MQSKLPAQSMRFLTRTWDRWVSLLSLTPLDKCHSWKEKTFFVLNQFPEKKARLDEIGSKITQVVSEAEAEGSQAYHDQINVWERNLLKMFSKHKSIFDTSNSKPIFYIW